jgi:hypothetical protein
VLAQSALIVGGTAKTIRRVEMGLLETLILFRPGDSKVSRCGIHRWVWEGLFATMRLSSSNHGEQEPDAALPHREKQREYDRKYSASEKGRAREARKYERRKMESPEKLKARYAVRYAVRTGKLVKMPCWCGDLSEAHHEDYSKPLEVQWLCKKHHDQLHIERNALVS